jgi:hypothetical protein
MLDLPPDRARVAASAGTRTLTYRSAPGAVGIAEYVVTCTLHSVADATPATFVEWMRMYRPAAAAGQEQIHTFARALIGQDRTVADHLATEYDAVETLYMDYTLGDTEAL